ITAPRHQSALPPSCNAIGYISCLVCARHTKADWYVWADPKPDGTAPNNWLSIFGGQGWEWDGVRRQYYQHNFLTSQPELNFHSKAVQEAVL
ncbi:alpha-amylase family glycosyl hydrolase, partial [Rhizobium johnstonii]